MNLGRRILLALLAITLLAHSVTAWAQSKRPKRLKRPVVLTRHAGRLVVSFEYPGVFDDRLRRRLSSGFTSNLLLRVKVVTGKSKPQAFGIQQFAIKYDVWEEIFTIKHYESGQQALRQVRTMKDVLAICGGVERMPLAEFLNPKPGKRYRVKIEIVVNPTSPRQQRQVRKYLANPDGSTSLGSPQSFFGSNSRHFVNEKDIQADAIYTIVSPKMEFPKK